MLYKKISVEVIVIADEAEQVVAELNAALDQMEETYTLFGGDIQATPFKHSGIRRKSALAHSVAAVGTATDALRTARKNVAVALRAVI